MDFLFEQMIHELIEQNYITMENYFLDGNKIEADANKYSFVWKKATQNFEDKLNMKIPETLQHINELAAAEGIPLNNQAEQVIPKQKVHTEFGILAMAHNLLKIASIRQLFSGPTPINQKNSRRKGKSFLRLFYFWGL